MAKLLNLATIGNNEHQLATTANKCQQLPTINNKCQQLPINAKEVTKVVEVDNNWRKKITTILFFLQCALVGSARGQCHHHTVPWPNLPMHTRENIGCVKPWICGPINTWVPPLKENVALFISKIKKTHICKKDKQVSLAATKSWLDAN